MRKIKQKTLIISLLVIIYLFLCGSQYSIFPVNDKSESYYKYSAKCIRVVDGDTIEVLFTGKNKYSDNKEKIRFIGVNTPEMNKNNNKKPEYWAKEATEFTRKELEGHNIELSFDDISSTKDKYDRLLCYVWIDDYLFNKILIESGNARYYSNFKFNNKYMKLFSQAEEYAKNNKMGMWK